MYTKLPTQYEDFIDIFEKKKVHLLPNHRVYDYASDLQSEAQPLFGSIYNLSRNELIELHKYVDKNLSKIFIEHSKSPIGAAILFVKKKNHTLHMFVDYFGFNKLIVKNPYPLLLISNLLDQLQQATIYTKTELCGACNWSALRKATNGRQLSEQGMATLNIMSCHLGSLMMNISTYDE